MDRRRTGLASGLVLTLVGTGAAAVLLREPAQPACPVSAVAESPQPQLVSRDALLPEGSEGSRRQVVVEAIESIGGPVGRVATGRFFERLERVPSVVVTGGSLTLVTAPPGGGAALDVLDPGADGRDTRTAWHVGLSADPRWSAFTGGAVDQDVVLAFSGVQPTLLALSAADGREVSCTDLGGTGDDDDAADPLQVRTDQAGRDVVVATGTLRPTGADSAGGTLARITPSTGDLVWRESLGSGTAPATVQVAGDQVLLARADTATVATSGLPRPEPGGGPWLEARSLGSGEPTWSWGGAEDPEAPAAVLLDVDDEGTAYALLVGARRVELAALAPDGSVRWRREAPSGSFSADLWGDRLVVRGPDGRGGPGLRAYDSATGRPVWRVTGRQAPPVGDRPRAGFGTALVEDGVAWTPAPNGLLAIDLTTGRARRADSAARVDQILQVGPVTAVVSGTALLLTTT